MDGDSGHESAPKLTAASLLLCMAVSLGSVFITSLGGALPTHWGPAAADLATTSPLVFLSASFLVFRKPRFGYTLGVVAGLIPVPWLYQTEFSPAGWNSWVFQNYNEPTPFDAEAHTAVTIARLKILSVTLIVVAVTCSALRLLPAHWSLRKYPLCRRTWPAFAVGFLVLAVWFGCSVTPYDFPAFHHGAMPDSRILHVEKRGLRFHETGIFGSRNGVAWIARTARRLFQYRFEERVAMASLGEASPATLERARTFIQSPALRKLRTPTPKALRSWNADGWYVVLKDSRLLAFTSEYGTSPPKEVVDLFQEIENVPVREERRSAARDVCLGFCYDPIAGLGFPGLRQRTSLLSRNSQE